VKSKLLGTVFDVKRIPVVEFVPNLDTLTLITECLYVVLEVLRAVIATCLHACILFALFFDPEVGDDIFPRIVQCYSIDYTMLYPRKYYSE
jgi:hypothetical protein